MEVNVGVLVLVCVNVGVGVLVAVNLNVGVFVGVESKILIQTIAVAPYMAEPVLQMFGTVGVGVKV